MLYGPGHMSSSTIGKEESPKDETRDGWGIGLLTIDY